MPHTAVSYKKVFAVLIALWLGAVAWAQEPIIQDTLSRPEPRTLQIDSLSGPEPQALQIDSLSGPEPQTLQIDSLAKAAIAAIKPRTFHPDPIRSQWVSMVLPGGGQIYNRKFWKLPIIYGGFLGCAYALSWNGQMLRDYSQAYLDIMDSDPNTKSYEKMLPLGYDISGREDKFKEIFKNKKNYYRKYRDMSILAFVAVYVIGIIDAYVDAELSSFDISPDLSLRMTPTIIDTKPAGMSTLHSRGSNIGLALSLDF